MPQMQGLPPRWGSPGCGKLPGLPIQVLHPSTGSSSATDQLYLQVPGGVLTIRFRSLVKKAICQQALA